MASLNFQRSNMTSVAEKNRHLLRRFFFRDRRPVWAVLFVMSFFSWNTLKQDVGRGKKPTQEMSVFFRDRRPVWAVFNLDRISRWVLVLSDKYVFCKGKIDFFKRSWKKNGRAIKPGHIFLSIFPPFLKFDSAKWSRPSERTHHDPDATLGAPLRLHRR